MAKIEDEIMRAFALHEKGQLSEAEAAYRKVLQGVPNEPNSLYNLGFLCYQTGRLEEALRYLEKTTIVDPANGDAVYAMARIYAELGQLDQAHTYFDRLLVLNPSDPAVHDDLGVVYKIQGLLDKAMACFDRAIALAPAHASALNNRGNVFLERNRLDEAIADYRAAARADPSFSSALVSCGMALQKKGEYEAGREVFDEALKMDSSNTLALWLYHLALPVLYDTEQEIPLRRRQFESGLETVRRETRLETPQQKMAAWNALAAMSNFYLPYQGGSDLELQKSFGELCCRVVAVNRPEWALPRKKIPKGAGQKIRVAFVTDFLRDHTVGKLFVSWVEKLNKERFEVDCYCFHGAEDRFAERFKNASRTFYRAFAGPVALAEKLLADKPDVIVYPDIGMTPRLNVLAAARLAPVQCVAWGHPITSGLATIDYFLTSELMELAEADAFYSEKLVRLANLSVAYDKPVLPANLRDRRAFGLPEDRFLFLSPQALFKYLPQYDELFPKIAKLTTRCHFVFIANASQGVTEKFRLRIFSAFTRAGLDPKEFVTILPQLNYEAYLGLNRICDALLDTLSWSGGNTTLEGVGMGLPVVTCPSRFMRSRHTAAILQRLGLDELIAADEDDYVAKAARLAQDHSWCHALREKILAGHGQLYGDEAAIRSLEEFFERALFD